MAKIDDRALAQSITGRGDLSGKADNANRLAKALMVARRHPDTQDVLSKLSPDQLRHVVREASVVLQVKRKSKPTQNKIQSKLTLPMQKAFADQLRLYAEQQMSGEPHSTAALGHLSGNDLAQNLAAASNVNVRADNWHNLHGGNTEASAYNSGFWRAAVAAKEQIDTHPATTAKQTIAFLAQKRRDLALAANAPESSQFGIDNMSTVTTFLNNERYGQFLALRPIVERVISWSREFGITRQRPIDLPGNIAISNRGAGEECFFNLSMQTNNGKNLPLSTYTVELDPEGEPKTWENGTPMVTVNGASNWNEIGSEVERLYDKALVPLRGSFSVEQHLQAVGENIGRLHYLLAHNPQYRRGSAGIYDMLVASIFLRQGYIFPGWKEKTAGDIQALGTLDSEHYAKGYLQLMRSVPGNRVVVVE